jgi:PKD repeat protein
MNKFLRTSAAAVFTVISISGMAQTMINFDDAAKWTAGSAGLGSYALNHTYIDGVFTATGGNALRGTTTAQDGFSGANGTYAWRLENTATVDWRMTIANGGVGVFSVAVRRWDGSPSPNYNLEYSIDNGSTWEFVALIDNAALDNLSDWKTFNGTINSANNEIVIRFKSNGTTERIMVDDFYWEPYGAVSPSPTVSFASATQSVSESVGTLTVNVNLTNSDANAIEVDVVLGAGGTATLGDDFSFTPVTLTFPGGSNSTQTFTVDIIDDTDFEPTETIVFELTNPTNGAIIGANGTFTLSILDNDISPITPCSELFFSEYIEGSSNNKAVEIYNPTTGVIDLANYSVRSYTNGSATVSSQVILSGLLQPGQTFVIANSQANAAILSKANITSGVMSFTGDDALELYNITDARAIDVIGVIGNDPGDFWVVGTGTTQNHTLVRKSNVDLGTTVWLGDGDTQWDVYAQDSFNDLKMHTNSGCGSAIPVVVAASAPNSGVCQGVDVTFTAEVYGGVAPYSFEWDIDGDIVTSNTPSLTYVYADGGPSSITVTAIDVNNMDDAVSFPYSVFPAPSTGFMADVVLCSQFVEVTSTVTGTYTYAYTVSSGLTIENQDANSGEASLTGSAGMHTITQTITDINTCSAMESQDITITLPPNTSFTIPSAACQGEILDLSGAIAFGEWSGSGVADNGDGTGEFDTDGLDAGIYEITFSTIGICGSFTTEEIEVLATPEVNFTFTTGYNITFTNTSDNMVFPTAINWDFGDGNVYAGFDNPTHEYQANGSYTVCLEVENGNGCTEEICKTIEVVGVSVKEIAKNNTVLIYPNPSNGQFTLQLPSTSLVTVTNVIGKEVYRNTLTGTSAIDLSNLSAGTYFVSVKGGDFNQTKKMVIR